MPRNWLKSTNLTEWKATRKYLLNPIERQLIATEKEKKGTEWLAFIKNQLLYNPTLRKLYQDRLYNLDKAWTKAHRWSSTMVDLPGHGGSAEPSMTVVGIGSAAQGGHYDTIYLDDIIGDAALDSVLVMEDAERWFDNVPELLLQPDFNAPNASEVNLIGSPWGPGDIYDYAKRENPEYEWRIVPALKDTDLEDTDNIKWIQDPDAQKDESNWPERVPTKYYHEMRASNELQIKFWSQHQCNPHKATGLRKIEAKWLKYYRTDERLDGIWLICIEDDGKDGEEFKLSRIPLYGMIDPASFRETKSVKRGGRSVILIGGQPVNSIKKFVAYTWADRPKRPSLFLNEVFDAHEEYKPRHWQIDSPGSQPYIYQDILEERKTRGSSLSISMLPIDTKKDSKDIDIQALINPIANGEIYIHRTMSKLITELREYPGGMTVDLIDMLGKLNKYRWSRREREDMKVIREREGDYYQERGRSEVTGY